ncbi:MAG: bifunctional lysylphosphatidylglycerol flippase/synthetase MprF [Paracoccaceae bacterium]|nr:bifunctional lysylphosphatidylglycerol flippase/synthetase MprF [Paracoccaceae bacterium]
MNLMNAQLRMLARRSLPILIGILLFSLGLYALFHLMQSVNAADVFAQMRATPLSNLVWAICATAIGYVALMGYDWSALQFLEKPMPGRVVALGSFLGCAFGNTIGISVISGGAVRYRIYAAFGLNGFEVAALSSYIAIAMGVGLTWIGITALAVYPSALQGLIPLAADVVRLWAIAGSVGMFVLVFGISAFGGVLRFWRFEFAMPPVRILIVQLVANFADVVMAALTLYLLLPAGIPDFPAFIAIYAAATMVGVLSHVPGGVGVFETVIMAAMPEGSAVGDVAAGLLMFRIVYYLLPFAVAFLMVSFNEARHAGGFITRRFGDVPAALRPAFAAISGIVPGLVGFLVLCLGAYLLLVSVWPTARASTVHEGELIAAILREGGTLLSSVAGVVLLILSHGLVRRVSGAYWLTLITLAGGILAAVSNDLDLESAAILAISAVALVPFSGAFHRHTKLTEGVFGPAWFALVLAIMAAVGAFFFFVHETTSYSHDLWVDFSARADTPRALRAGILGSAVFLFFAVYTALQPTRRPMLPPQGGLMRAMSLVRAQSDPQACLVFSGDKAVHFDENGTGFVMFGRRGRLLIAYGDPIMVEDTGVPALVGLAQDFIEMAEAQGGAAIFYAISAAHLPVWTEIGLTVHEIGAEAVIALQKFSWENTNAQAMRPAFRQKQHAGFRVEVVPAPHSPALIAELAMFSAQAGAAKTGRENGFSVGRFSPEYLNETDIALIRHAGQVVGFANILLPGRGGRYGVDMVRFRSQQGPELMEFLFLSLIEHYRALGGQELSLGMAPLAGLSPRRTGRLWNRVGVVLFPHAGLFDNFEALRAFKQSFQPEWRARYLAVPPGLSPMVALADVALLVSGGKSRALGK